MGGFSEKYSPDASGTAAAEATTLLPCKNENQQLVNQKVNNMY